MLIDSHKAVVWKVFEVHLKTVIDFRGELVEIFQANHSFTWKNFVVGLFGSTLWFSTFWFKAGFKFSKSLVEEVNQVEMPQNDKIMYHSYSKTLILGFWYLRPFCLFASETVVVEFFDKDQLSLCIFSWELSNSQPGRRENCVILEAKSLNSQDGKDTANYFSRPNSLEKYSIFRSARTSCWTFDFSTRPVRDNFSWVQRWAVTLPSGLRYPSNHIFSESWWCQLSKFRRKYKYKDKYRYKYKDRDK